VCVILGLEFSEDDLREVKFPKRLPVFDMSVLEQLDMKVPIVKLACGGMHSAAIAASGAVYTWGNNDNHALGRSGVEDKPMLVSKLPARCNGVSTGASHTVFFNTESNETFICGLYRVSQRYPDHTVSKFPPLLFSKIWRVL
jgi:alpha-tubulin suppressor-like RCC1 family protein